MLLWRNCVFTEVIAPSLNDFSIVFSSWKLENSDLYLEKSDLQLKKTQMRILS